MSSSLDIKAPILKEILVGFILDEVTKIGLKKVVLGLSGGIDSTVSAYLAVEALGSENVLPAIMPYATSSSDSLSDASLVSEKLNLKPIKIDITPMVDAFFQYDPEADLLRRGNRMARERMSILYDLSANFKALVLGTSNKSELLLGYGTMYGDLACAINAIGDLYKTQVRQLAQYLEVPEHIITKPPSADFWKGQSDEQDLGISYDILDVILFDYVDLRRSEEDLINSGHDPELVKKIIEMVRISQFKRRLPVIAKVSHRTIDRDFRYARDWGY